MTRILPIIILTVGLVLLSSSFATAATTETEAQPLAQWCALEDRPTEAAAAIDRPAPQLGRCGKKLSLGILISCCKVDAQLPQARDIEPEPVRAYWAINHPLIGPIGAEPFLDLPPPKA